MNPRRSQNPFTTFGLLFLCAIGFLWFAREVKNTDETYKRLWAIEGVTGVEKLSFERTHEGCIQDKYLVTFEQPIDWKNPELGTFSQRVEIGITDKATVNLMHLDGYALQNDLLGRDYVPELVEMYRTNYIHIEHRFFGASSPDNLSYDQTGYWEYLTSENAAADYHSIYSRLAPLLGETWISYGESYGGLLSDVYASLYPEDCKLYVSFAAPCPDGINDKRLYDYIYTDIGTDAYGKEQAREYRNLITQFQVDLIKNKQDLLGLYNDAIDKTGMRFREHASKEVLYDINVLEFAVKFWQHNQEFDKLEQLLTMPEDTADNRLAKAQAEFNFMISVQGPEDWSPDKYTWPYYVSAATETGEYYHDFLYLRAALTELGIQNEMTVTPDMEETLLWDITFTDEQKNAFSYDGDFRDRLISSLKNTDAKMLMIYGATDPLYAVRLPNISNDNIRQYVHPGLAHTIIIQSFPDDTLREIKGYIDQCISE